MTQNVMHASLHHMTSVTVGAGGGQEGGWDRWVGQVGGECLGTSGGDRQCDINYHQAQFCGPMMLYYKHGSRVVVWHTTWPMQHSVCTLLL